MLKIRKNLQPVIKISSYKEILSRENLEATEEKEWERGKEGGKRKKGTEKRGEGGGREEAEKKLGQRERQRE